MCGNRLFFHNTACVRCERRVGWVESLGRIAPVEGEDAGQQVALRDADAEPVTRCQNWVEHGVCNRLLAVGGASKLCAACRLNRTVPDLKVAGNSGKWARLELAKRRLLYTLDMLGLPWSDPHLDPPLSFDFKADILPPAGDWRGSGEAGGSEGEGGGEQVYTGHDHGLITINIKEADPAHRERTRVEMGESHRTLIGHFRHEVGHYYWDVLIKGNADREAAFNQTFGDPENPTYAEALERHYQEGPPEDWRERYVSSYATMHPWEDWAEAWAFYLDMIDVLDTAKDAGLTAVEPGEAGVQETVAAYVRLGLLMNELNRSQGLKDLVPEVVTPAVGAKLRAVEGVVRGA